MSPCVYSGPDGWVPFGWVDERIEITDVPALLKATHELLDGSEVSLQPPEGTM
jgi:hypothetical protein